MADNVQQEELGTDVLSASLAPVFESQDAAANPEATLLKAKQVYDQGQGKWSKEAQDYFSDISGRFSNAAKIEYDTSAVDNTPFPNLNDEKLTKDDKLKAIDDWKTKAQDYFSKSGSNYLIAKSQIDPEIEDRVIAAKHSLNTDEWDVKDYTSRLANATLGAAAGAVQLNESDRKAAANYFDTKPQNDDSDLAAVTDFIGSASPMVLASYGAGAIATMAGAPEAAPLASAVVAAIVGGSQNYASVYDESLKRTGSTHAAHVDALTSGVSEGAIMGLAQHLTAAKVFGPWFSAADTEVQRKGIAGLLSTTASPIVKHAVESGATGALSMGAMSGASSIKGQLISGQYTNEPVDYSKVLKDLEYGTTTGFLWGAVEGAGAASFRSYKDRGIDPPKPKPTKAPENTPPPPPGETPPPGEASPLDSLGSAEANFDTVEITPPAKEALPEEPTVIPPGAQVDVQKKLENFKGNPNAKYIILKGVKPENMPPLMEEMNDVEFLEDPGHPGDTLVRRLKVTDTDASPIDRNKQVRTGEVRHEIVPVDEPKEVSTPNAEEVRRLAEIPGLIEQEQTKLLNTPSHKDLQKRVEGQTNYVEQLQKQLPLQKNPIGVQRLKEQIQTQQKLLNSYKKDLNRELYSGLFTAKKEASAKRIKELQLQLDSAKHFSDVVIPDNEPSQMLTLGKADHMAKLQEAIDHIDSHSNEEIKDEYNGRLDKVKASLDAWESEKSLGIEGASKDRENAYKDALDHFNAYKEVYVASQTPEGRNIYRNGLHKQWHDELNASNEPSESKSKEGVKASVKKPSGPMKYSLAKDTNSTYTGEIETPLRNVVNHQLAGIGIRNVHVSTVDEAKAKLYDNHIDPRYKKILEEALTRTTNAGGNAHVSKDRSLGVILLKDGAYNDKSALVAMHEVGHLVEKMLLKQDKEALAKVNADYAKARGQLSPTARSSTVAKAMIGAGYENTPFDVETPYKKLSKEKREYLVGDKVGFEEFVANRVSRRMAQLADRPGSIAKDVYGKIGEALLRAWKSLDGRFKEAPALDEFLQEHWSEARAREMFKPGPGKDTKAAEALGEGKIRESAISRNIRTAPKNSNIPEHLREYYSEAATYGQRADRPVLEEARKSILKRGADVVAEDLMANNSTIPFGDKSLWFKEVLRAYNHMADFGKSAEEKDYGAYNAKVVSTWAEGHARGSGREVEGFKTLKDEGRVGLQNYIKDALGSTYSRNKMVRPENFDEIVETAVNKYWTMGGERPGPSPGEEVAPEGLIKNSILKEILNDVDKEAGYPSSRKGWTYWYGNILSGIGTHYGITRFSGLDTAAKVYESTVAFPKDTTSILSGLKAGIGRGVLRAKASLTGLPVLRGHQTDPSQAIRSAPQVDWGEGAVGKNLAKVVNGFLKLQQYYPLRTVAGLESFFRGVGEGIESHLSGMEFLREKLGSDFEKLSSVEKAAKLSDLLHNSKEEWMSAQAQAGEELQNYLGGIRAKQTGKAPKFTQTEIDTRAMEIINSRIMEENQDLAKSINRAGNKLSMTGRPEGGLGLIADAVKKVTGGAEEAIYAFPVINASLNALNRMLDYSPVGIFRGAKGHTNWNYPTKERAAEDAQGFKKQLKNRDGTLKVNEKGEPIYEMKTVPVKWSKVESRQRLVAGITGTMAMIGLAYSQAARIRANQEGGKGNNLDGLDFYGYGPTDKGERETWLTQHSPYSMELGGIKFKYAETPFMALFGWLGAVSDNYKYNKSFNRQNDAVKLANIGLAASYTLTDIGMLKSLANLVDLVHTPGDAKSKAASLTRFLTQSMKGYIPFSGLQSDIAKITDPDKPESGSMMGALLYGIPIVQSAEAGVSLNNFGEPIDKEARFWPKAKNDPVWKFLADNDLHLTGMPGQITIGTGSGDEKPVHAAILEDRKTWLGRFAYNVFTSEEKAKMIQISGPRIKEQIAALADSGTIDPEDKEKYQEYINKIVSKEHTRAKLQVAEESYQEHNK